MVHLIFHLPLSFGFWVGETGGVFEASKGALVLLGGRHGEAGDAERAHYEISFETNPG